MDNVVTLPHVGSATETTRRAMADRRTASKCNAVVGAVPAASGARNCVPPRLRSSKIVR